MALGPFFMFFAPRLIFDDKGGVGSHFHVLRSLTHFRRYQERRVPFSCFALPFSYSAVPRASSLVLMFFAPGLIFEGTVGDRSRFHVLRSRTRFKWYRDRRSCFHVWRTQIRFRRFRGRRVQFSCFALPNTFSAVSWASGPFFMFCAAELVFGGTEGVGSCFHGLLSRTRFRWYLGRRVPFSCFALRDSFSTVARASCAVFMFCAPELVFGGTVGV
jgi:hypothetical protein